MWSEPSPLATCIFSVWNRNHVQGMALVTKLQWKGKKDFFFFCTWNSEDIRIRRKELIAAKYMVISWALSPVIGWVLSSISNSPLSFKRLSRCTVHPRPGKEYSFSLLDYLFKIVFQWSPAHLRLICSPCCYLHPKGEQSLLQPKYMCVFVSDDCELWN